MALRLRSRTKLSPEHDLLLACARSRLGPEHLARVRKASRKGIDWDILWPLARVHGVGYFVGNHLCGANAITNGDPKPTDGCPSALPPRVRNQVQHDLWQETAHALILRDQQLRLNAELSRADIPVLWLKGLILADRLYGQYEARHCGDLDLLADPSDIPRLEELLAQLGFERFRPSEAGTEFHPMAAHHTTWSARVLPDWQLIVEVHHRVSGPASCQPAAADLLHRSRLISFHGQDFRVPSLEDELLILCLHAHHHQYALLRCLLDVPQFVGPFRDQIDWPELLARARRYRCLGRLGAALEITDALLGLENSDEVLDQVPALTPRQRWAIRSLPMVMLLDPRTQENDLRQAQLALLMDSWADAVRMLSPRIFPSGEHVRSLCPIFWRGIPGLARLYYYAHSISQLLRHGTAGSLVRAR